MRAELPAASRWTQMARFAERTNALAVEAFLSKSAGLNAQAFLYQFIGADGKRGRCCGQGLVAVAVVQKKAAHGGHDTQRRDRNNCKIFRRELNWTEGVSPMRESGCFRSSL